MDTRINFVWAYINVEDYSYLISLFYGYKSTISLLELTCVYLICCLFLEGIVPQY
jgi:hypothetical protein